MDYLRVANRSWPVLRRLMGLHTTASAPRRTEREIPLVILEPR